MFRPGPKAYLSMPAAVLGLVCLAFGATFKDPQDYIFYVGFVSLAAIFGLISIITLFIDRK